MIWNTIVTKESNTYIKIKIQIFKPKIIRLLSTPFYAIRQLSIQIMFIPTHSYQCALSIEVTQNNCSRLKKRFKNHTNLEYMRKHFDVEAKSK